MRRPAALLLLTLSACALSACNGIDFGGQPGPDVRKQTGPLTTPPPDVVSGKAR